MFVYFHRDPVTYQIFYVGIGSRKDRAYNFKNGRNPFWHNYINKHGEPVVQIVHINLSKDEVHYWERFYIQLLGKRKNGGQLTNITDGGDASPELSPESQARSTAALIKWMKENPDKNSMKRPEVAAKHAGDNNPMKRPEVVEKVRMANIGKKLSEETKQKLRDTRIGKVIPHLVGYKHSPEVLERMKIINKEIVNRPEVKEKIRLSKLGIRNKSTGVNMIDINTGSLIKTFSCITDALIELNKPTRCGNITQVCKGKRNYAFGYKWEYAA